MSIIHSQGPAPLSAMLGFGCVLLALLAARCWPLQPARQRQAAARLLLDGALAALVGSALGVAIWTVLGWIVWASSTSSGHETLWQAGAGLLCAVLWLGWRLRHRAPLRKPVLGAGLLGVLAWCGCNALLHGLDTPAAAASGWVRPGPAAQADCDLPKAADPPR